MNYSLGEELISAITHGIGAGLAIAGLVLMIVKAAQTGAVEVTSAAVYGGTLFIMYICSTMYHALGHNKAKKVFRVLDHCGVFLLIAGTYTPYTLVALGGAFGWSIFGFIWGLTILGIVFNSIDLEKYEKLSMIVNIIMGWTIVIAMYPLCRKLDIAAIILLIAGGVVYSVGAVLYANGHKKKYMHSLWHFFVLGGSVLHFFSLYLYVL
ncbi:MAG: hemolysin III family protein [Lachnospiraceae bacterium]|nr:hemolysin III family protein [Lachnospiraceae bacterium]